MRLPILISCALALALPCGACAIAATPRTAQTATSPSVELRGHRIHVEVAADDASRAHGLMDRTSMPADHGMLFVFPNEAVRSFWMKNTLIPLDMLFFDGQRKLITLLRDVPPCRSDPCPAYPSAAPARYVLELNAGAASKLGVREGNRMTLVSVPTEAQ
ncbi:MAG: DUF192 domain-containing protein [Pseudomonadota bacterium]|nr:DUF192 domain-containing protein [Pseudomonadota bacterium]